MSRTRVGLNLLWLVPGVVGGSEEYTTRLLRAVHEARPADLDLVVFGNQAVLAAYPELGEQFTCVAAPVDGSRKMLRVATENSWLARAARRHRIDLFHHLGGIMPFIRTVPGVVTIHDLQPLVMPQHFHPAKRWFARASIPPSARHARVIVTLTEATRAMLVERLGVDPARIEVIPAGIRVPTAAEVAQEKAVDVRGVYGLGDAPLFLYPAITYPHKNHVFLVRAFAPVARRSPEVRLVLTGGSAQSERALADEVAALGIGTQVRRLGRIPRAHVDALYHEATALAFPSRFEGFGMPLLEAMGRGCPVLAADATALPEVGGDAAVLLPLDDGEPWTEAMIRLLTEPEHRGALAEAGRARARQFDWATVAERFLAVYRRARMEG